jgi:hypothetical protein
MKLLRFFSLLDRAGRLSWTNVGLVVVLTKVALAPTVSLGEAGSLLLVLANYAHKRKLSVKAEAEAERHE